jgi:methylthioribose-1-phosphate isomerase
MATIAEIAAAAGTVLGSAAGSFALARQALKKRRKDDSEGMAQLRADVDALRAERVTKTDLLAALEPIQQEIRQELRHLRESLGEFLRTEEFTAYTQMDSDRRERLITEVGRLRGTLDVLLK